MLIWIPLVLFVWLPLAVYFYAVYVNTFWRRHGVPYTPATPVVGNLRDMIVGRRCAADHYQRLYAEAVARRTPVLGMHIFMKPALLLCDRELIKRVLVKDFGAFSNRHSTSDLHTDLLGTANLFFVKSPTWRVIRTRLTPFFTGGKMRQMFGLMSAIGDELHATLVQKRAQAGGGDADTEMRDLMARYTTDIIASCAFGVQANSLRDPEADFRREGRSMFEYTLWRAVEFTSMFFLPEIVPFCGFKTFSRRTSAFLRESIEYVMDERERTGAQRNDLIDTLLVLRKEDAGKRLSADNIVFQGDVLVAQAASFFSAGFETSSAVLAFGMFELCRRPDIQERIREEIRQTLQANDGRLTYDAVAGMEYLGMVISEVLRLYPPLPFLDRECTVSESDGGAYSLLPESSFHVPKGMPVVIPVYAIQRDPQYFPNPLLFDPERFSPQRRDDILPYTYMPFGTGPHNCIGERFGLLQTRLGFINFFRAHRVEPSARTPQRLRLDTKALLVTAAGGVYLNVVPAAEVLAATATKDRPLTTHL